MRRRSLLSGFLLLAAAGCTHFQEPPIPVGQEISGRFSIIVTQQGNRRTNTGNFALILAEGTWRLDVGHPLAGIQARITSMPGVTRLETADGTIRTGTAPEQLMQQELGFFLPVEELSKWISRPSDSSIPRSDQGWEIVCLEQDGEGRPALVRLTRAEAETAPGIRLTVVIDKRLEHGYH